MRIGSPRDFGAGLLFMAFGLFFVARTGTLTIGSAARIGPGYFPLVLGMLLAVIGLVLVVRAVALAGPRLEAVNPRPFFTIPAGIGAFALLLPSLGLVIASATLAGVAAMADRGFRWKETLALAVGLAALSAAIFVYALGLPLPLWPRLAG